MALVMFTVFANGRSAAECFDAAKESPLLASRARYEIIDPTTLYPSDKHAELRAEYIFGVQPQEDKVYIAGEHTNTAWAVLVRTTEPGIKRMMFFGLRRI